MYSDVSLILDQGQSSARGQGEIGSQLGRGGGRGGQGRSSVSSDRGGRGQGSGFRGQDRTGRGGRGRGQSNVSKKLEQSGGQFAQQSSGQFEQQSGGQFESKALASISSEPVAKQSTDDLEENESSDEDTSYCKYCEKSFDSTKASKKNIVYKLAKVT